MSSDSAPQSTSGTTSNGGGKQQQQQQQQQSTSSSAQQQQSTQSWTLFVGQIPNDVNEETLKHLFSTYGLVTESKILMDKLANKPKGCGFITYADRHGAETAIATLHEKYTLPGSARPLIVRYSTKQLAADKSSDPGPFKLYISNLSKQTTEDEIRTMFSQYGQLIDDIVILRDQMSSVSKGVAFVRFQNRAEAQAAITALNEQIRDKDAPNLMQVKYAHTPQEKKVLATQKQQHQMMHSNGHGNHGMHPAAASTAVGGYYSPQQHYQQSASAPGGPHYQQQQHGGYNPYMQHNMGYGYPMQQGGQGHQQHHGGGGGGGHHQPRQSQITKGPEGANLFVYGIPEAYTDTDLSGMFQNFGNVINAKVYRDLSTQKSKGFGFVSFDNVPSAQQACASMDGYQIAGKKMTVKPKSENANQGDGNGGGSYNSSSSSSSSNHHQQQHQGRQQQQQQPHHHQQQQQHHSNNNNHQQHQQHHHHQQHQQQHMMQQQNHQQQQQQPQSSSSNNQQQQQQQQSGQGRSGFPAY